MRGLAQISSKPKPVFTSECVNLLIISFTYDTVPLKLGKYNEGADYRTLPWRGGGWLEKRGTFDEKKPEPGPARAGDWHVAGTNSINGTPGATQANN